MQAITRWLRKPASRWARIPAGILLIIGGCLAILPVFGLWMFLLGLMLLADDIPPLRRFRDRALDWLGGGPLVCGGRASETSGIQSHRWVPQRLT